MFLIYINGLLSVELKTEFELFTNGTSLFSVVQDINIFQNEPNIDLPKLHESAYQSKMKFNPDTSKKLMKYFFVGRFRDRFIRMFALATIQSTHYQFTTSWNCTGF